MNVGTKSVLYGYHCAALHWAFVLRGWLRMYGVRRVYIGERHYAEDLVEWSGRRYPASYTRPVYARVWNPRVLLAFVVHDLGYWGSPNMDGPEGERHPETGARILKRICGEPWGRFCLYHSRFYAKRDGAKVSALCFADKMAITYYPEWLMVRLVTWTGEVHEYMKDATRQIESDAPAVSVLEWFRAVKTYVRAWVAEHQDGREDTWTPGAREAKDATGVWK